MTLLGPIALYDAETWALRKTEELSLRIFEASIKKNLKPSL